MAKIVVYKDDEPEIGIVLEQEHPLHGVWRGECTQCGFPVRTLFVESGVRLARHHVDSCTS